MSALKKKVICDKISTFRERNQLLLFFNYNHINIQSWYNLKENVKRVVDPFIEVDFLVVKNQINVNPKSTSYCLSLSLLPVPLTPDTKTDTDPFQGPTILMGLSIHNLIQETRLCEEKEICIPTGLCIERSPCNYLSFGRSIIDLINSEKKCGGLYFAMGLYQNRFLNHLEFDYLLKVEKVAYPTLLSNLQSNIDLKVVSTPLIVVCSLLGFYKQVKTKQETVKQSSLDSIMV